MPLLRISTNTIAPRTIDRAHTGAIIEIDAIPFSVADIFCGGGGLTTGLARAGVDVLASVDHNRAAVATCRANHQHDVHLFDLSDIAAAATLLRPYRPLMLAGGPPCQDFSSSGPRCEGARADLTHAFVRIGIELGCHYILMENVDRAIKAEVYQAAMTRLSSEGYGVSLFILDASYYGVPQVRKRAVLVAKRGAGDKWLAKPEPVSHIPMTVRDHLGTGIDVEHYYRHPRSYARRSVFSVDAPSPTIRGTNRPVPRGHPSHPGDAADVSTVRPLTTAERARLQTFPPEYIWQGTRTEIEQMIGNAVPVVLGEILGRAILQDHICDRRTATELLAG